MEIWAMDIMGPLPETASGHRYILVATDLFSKWVVAVPLVDQKASSVARAFVENCILHFGVPRILLTDQGSNFESLLMKEVCLILGIKKVRTSAFHPRTDGQTERANRTIKQWIASSGGPWDEELPFIVFAINCTQSSATKFSPFQLVFGRHPPLLGVGTARQPFSLQGSIFEYVEDLHRRLEAFRRVARGNVERSKEDARWRYNEGCRVDGWIPFCVGEKVRYKNHYPESRNRKFSARFRGPFEVEARRGVNYKIGGGRGGQSRWVHHDELRPWRTVQREEVAVSGDCQRVEARGSEVVEEVNGQDPGSDSSSDSCSEGGGVEEEEERMVEMRPQRSRRQPVWMKDYVM
jgi:hypothetical protein